MRGFGALQGTRPKPNTDTLRAPAVPRARWSNTVLPGHRQHWQVPSSEGRGGPGPQVSHTVWSATAADTACLLPRRTPRGFPQPRLLPRCRKSPTSNCEKAEPAAPKAGRSPAPAQRRHPASRGPPPSPGGRAPSPPRPIGAPLLSARPPAANRAQACPRRGPVCGGQAGPGRAGPGLASGRRAPRPAPAGGSASAGPGPAQRRGGDGEPGSAARRVAGDCGPAAGNSLGAPAPSGDGRPRAGGGPALPRGRGGC